MSTKKKEVPGQLAHAPITVLSASTDSGLNTARAMLLKDDGFDVVTSEDVEHAIQEMKKRSFDVLIFGSTLPG